MVLANAKKAVKEWRRYFGENERALQYDPMKVYRDWLGGSPCPFLRAGACVIYPVRPIDCRTYFSTSPCAVDSRGVVRMHFDVEKLANNMIMEEEEKQNGQMQTTPLHHWLLVHFFS